MDIDEYQKFAIVGVLPATRNHPFPEEGFALGLAGEAGEVVDDIKKRNFHDREIPLEHTAEELGDVLWYVANIATKYGYKLSDILDKNVSKLTNRYPEQYVGTIYAGKKGQ